MLSFAAPMHGAFPTESSSSSSPASTRSRRIAMLPPPPPPPPPTASMSPSSSPPVPARSPLRATPRTPPDVVVPPPEATFSKRKHALIELLSSERAYASDLALIRDVHIPLALGQPAPFLLSSASTASPPPTPQVPPMTKEDTKIIFGNIEELAVFSEVFCDKLEEALAGVLDPNGDGNDNVGELFLSMIPHMKPPYTTYITRHSSALAHLNALPQTPGLTAYLAQTHTLAQSYTHAWDLPSLLIKPVQRLLKYPLLLKAIMDDTNPGDARDKLREAHDKVEEVAKGVNDGQRRWEVVKNLLDAKHPPVRLKSMKGLKFRNGSKDSHSQLEILEKRLHACKAFVQDFARDIVGWSISLRDVISQLERWSITFGRVIGLGQPAHGSESLDLFIDIISSQISPIWISLDTAIHTVLLPKLARLLATTAQPLLLLEHMHALRPQHLQLLDLPISKTRPPAALQEASRDYLDLEAQLRTELPRYLDILERGFTGCIGQFADWQARFWKEVRAQWVELWDALNVEGDMTAGAADTVKVWWERWEEVEAMAARLGITKPRKEHARSSQQQLHRSSQSPGPAAVLATAFGPPPGPSIVIPSASLSTPTSRRHSAPSIDFEIDMRTLGSNDNNGGGHGTLGSPVHDRVVASPDSYSSFGAMSNNRGSGALSLSSSGGSPPKEEFRLGSGAVKQRSGDRVVVARRETEKKPFGRKDKDRGVAKHQSSRLPVVRVDDDRPVTPRQEISLPNTARLNGVWSPTTARYDGVEGGNGGLMKKASRESTTSLFQAAMHHHQHAQHYRHHRDAAAAAATSSSSTSSPRVSVHTSSGSAESAAASSSSSSLNHRLSMQSVDVHIGMDVHAPPPAPGTVLNEGPVNVGAGASKSLNAGANVIPTPSANVNPNATLHPPKPNPDANGTWNANEDADQETRGRMLKKPSMRKRFADAFRSPSKRPPRGSVSGPGASASPEQLPLSQPQQPQHASRSPPPSVDNPPPHSPTYPPPLPQPHPYAYAYSPQTPLYTCTVVHPFTLPPDILALYRHLPFLSLQIGDAVSILSEEGHPREHKDLPIRPEDDTCEDCLLLAREVETGCVGWALASFLVIVS